MARKRTAPIISITVRCPECHGSDIYQDVTTTMYLPVTKWEVIDGVVTPSEYDDESAAAVARDGLLWTPVARRDTLLCPTCNYTFSLPSIAFSLPSIKKITK